MERPFTAQQFVDMLSRYNREIWPLQWIAITLCVVVAALAFRKSGASGRIVSVLLCGLWLWNGALFQIGYAAQLSIVIGFFGAMFLLQALVFFEGATANVETYRFSGQPRSLLGLGMVLFSLVGYPMLALANGHAFPQMPMVGTAPCPTTIFTLGMLLAGTPKLPRWKFVLPLIWTAIGSNAIQFGMREDVSMAAAGLLTVGVILMPSFHRQPKAAPSLTKSAKAA